MSGKVLLFPGGKYWLMTCGVSIKRYVGQRRIYERKGKSIQNLKITSILKASGVRTRGGVHLGFRTKTWHPLSKQYVQFIIDSFTLRKVRPYYFTFVAHAKGRWVGQPLIEVFAR